jgi:hypothetical protein
VRFDKGELRDYRRSSLMKARTNGRPVLLAIVAACFLSFALVSASHWHSPLTGASVKSECQLCSFGHSPADVGATGPLLFAVLLVVWPILFSSANEHSLDPHALASPRAPPLR